MTDIHTMDSLKTEGNNLFKEKKYEEAIEKYMIALPLVENEKEKSIIHSNISATYCKLENYGRALEHAAVATKVNSDWYKAWYRLSFVLYKLEKIDQAKKAIDKTLELCKENDIESDFIKDLKRDIYRFGKDDNDTEDEEEVEPKILSEETQNNSNQMPNFNPSQMPNFNPGQMPNFMPMMDNLMNNDKIKSKLDSKEFQEKVMANQSNPFAMLNDPDMREIMGEMMRSMGKNN